MSIPMVKTQVLIILLLLEEVLKHPDFPVNRVKMAVLAVVEI